MSTSTRTELLTRETILKLLSDDEVSKVSTAEAGIHLAEGEEYLDLERLEAGVLKAAMGSVPPGQGDPKAAMGSVLPRKAVHEATWARILKQLAVFKKPS
jgi:hypothetical protein